MKANYTIEAGDVRVIRPLVYVRERSTRDFSQEVRLPVINENCPACFEEPKVRSMGSGPAVVSLYIDALYFLYFCVLSIHRLTNCSLIICRSGIE